MAYERNSANDLVWDETTGSYVSAVHMYTLTINPTPSTATVVLIASGYAQVGNSIEVEEGTSVTYTVSKTGYTTQTDDIVVNSTQTLDIRLSRVWPTDNALHLQMLRGTHDENIDYTGVVGELTVDTELNQLRLHDGETVGGHVIGADNGDSDHGVCLFDTKWSDHLLNDECWLRTETFSWQDGDMYQLAYAHLVADIEGITPTVETIQNIPIEYYPSADGHKIVLANQEPYAVEIFEATGVAWYYILDTVNRKFKLPRASNPGTAWYMPLSVSISEFGANQQYLYMYIGNYKPASSDNTLAILNNLTTRVNDVHNSGTVTINQGNTAVAEFSLNQNEDVTVNLQCIPGLPESTEDDYTRVIRVGRNGLYELGSEQYTPNLFDVKRSDYQLNDPSWLCADTFSWHYGEMYEAAYAHLLEDIQPTTINSFEGTLSKVNTTGPWYRAEYLDHDEFYFWKNSTGDIVCMGSAIPTVGANIIPGTYASTTTSWNVALNAATTADIIGTISSIETAEGAVEKFIYLKPNVTLFGNAIVTSDGILSDAGASTKSAQASGLRIPNSSLELVVKTKMPDTYSNSDIVYYDINYHGIIIRATSATNLTTYISSNGTSWDIANAKTHTCTIPAGSTQWIKLTWDGATYTLWISTDGVNYTSLGTVASTAKVYWNEGVMNLGYNYTTGLIDLKESYVKIDGGYAWRGMDTLTYYEAKDGHRIVLADDEEDVQYLYNKTGNGWYYILDTANERFKLPRLKTRELVRTYNTDSRWYKLYSDGWVEQGGFIKSGAVTSYVLTMLVPMKDTDYTVALSPAGGDANDTGGTGDDLGVIYGIYNGLYPYGLTKTQIRVSTVSNAYRVIHYMVSGQSDIDISPLQVDKRKQYLYVGNFRKTALENTAGLNAELFNAKADVNAVVAKGHEVIEYQVPTAANSYTWYRLYADGWVEQGGKTTQTATTSVNATMVLPVEMQNTEYTVTFSVCSSVADDGAESNVSAQTVTTISLHADSMSSTSGTKGFLWQVSGMAAQ